MRWKCALSSTGTQFVMNFAKAGLAQEGLMNKTPESLELASRGAGNITLQNLDSVKLTSTAEPQSQKTATGILLAPPPGFFIREPPGLLIQEPPGLERPKVFDVDWEDDSSVGIVWEY